MTLQRNCIRVGDCIKVLQGLPDEVFDLTVFSPPYDGIRDYKKNWSLDYQELGAQVFRTSVEGATCAVVA